MMHQDFSEFPDPPKPPQRKGLTYKLRLERYEVVACFPNDMNRREAARVAAWANAIAFDDEDLR